MSKKSKLPNYRDHEWNELPDMILTGLERLTGRPRPRPRAEAVHVAYVEKLMQGVSTTVTSAYVHFQEALELMGSCQELWRIRMKYEFDGVQLTANFGAGDNEEIPWRLDDSTSSLASTEGATE